jgi:hypothetical protein
VGQQLYTAAASKASPMEFVTQSVSLFPVVLCAWRRRSGRGGIERGRCCDWLAFRRRGRCSAVDRLADCAGQRSSREGRVCG